MLLTHGHALNKKMCTCFFPSLWSLLILLVVFVFQEMLIYLDPESLGLEFHLGKKHTAQLKQPCRTQPRCSPKAPSGCRMETGLPELRGDGTWFLKTLVWGGATAASPLVSEA